MLKELLCCGCMGYRDIRTQKLLGTFEEFHTQDVLQVAFHPDKPSRLFSGGEDGLIAEFDMLVADPDEAVENIFNTEQPISRFGFFGPRNDCLYSISHVHSVDLYAIESGDQLAHFPDVRPQLAPHLATDYVLDCHYDAPSDALILTSGNRHGQLMLSQVTPGGVQPVCALGGAHTAMVRDINWSVAHTLYTCGEDARLCAWAPPGSSSPAAAAANGALDFKFDRGSARPVVRVESAVDEVRTNALGVFRE
jgi:WD40 repeat protein